MRMISLKKIASSHKNLLLPAWKKWVKTTQLNLAGDQIHSMAPAVFTTQHLRHQSFARRYHQAVAGGSHSTDLGKASFRQKISPGSSDKILLILYKHIYIYIYM